jgi:PhzF family phenazine biosynthesis protein
MKNSHQVIPQKEITQTRTFQVNAFVAKGCLGNPAGVCLLPVRRDVEYYRKVAVKMDMSETAFVLFEDGIYKLRWFTRNGSEVDLCGHATLAASHILWSKGYIAAKSPIFLDTRSGVLSARQDGVFITLDFPRDAINEIKSNKPDLAASLGVTPLYIGKTQFDYLVVVDAEETVKNLTPDFAGLKKLTTRGVIVTAKAEGKQYDFVSRFFAPAVGIDEDPVTGSAHCALGSYWGAILKKKELNGYQASREGGIVKVKVLKDRVLVGGKAKEISLSAELKKAILSY